eukprot:scaffold260916_cov40-Prasinocladus_malaysianus.AAC.1
MRKTLSIQTTEPRGFSPAGEAELLSRLVLLGRGLRLLQALRIDAIAPLGPHNGFKNGYTSSRSLFLKLASTRSEMQRLEFWRFVGFGTASASRVHSSQQ